MLDEAPEEVRRAAGMPVALCVFGKHAAWADHMEPLGALTPSLAEFRSRLYETGIRRQLDSGSWSALAEDGRVEDWGHEWITFGASGILVARLWSSVDGRGRKAYPMVAAIHLPTARPPESFEPLFALLAELEDSCMAVDAAAAVKSAIHAGRARLPDLISRLCPQHEEGVPVHERKDLVERIHVPGAGEGALARVFHQLGAKPRFGTAETGARGLFRLPLDETCFQQTVVFWRSLLSGYCAPGTPFSASHPVGAGWMDFQIGEFTDDFVFRLKATTGEVPPATTIPYNIPDETLRIVEDYVEAYLRGDPPASAGKPRGLWSRLGVPWYRGGA